MKIALASGAFGEKLMTDSVFNCLVNDQGGSGLDIHSSVQ